MPLLGSRNKKKATLSRNSSSPSSSSSTPSTSPSSSFSSSSSASTTTTINANSNNTNNSNYTNNNNASSIVYPQHSTLLSRLPMNASTPNVVYHHHHHQQMPYNLSNHTSPSLTDYTQPSSAMMSPFDSPTPTPSTSWTSEMSAFVDKLRDDAAAIVASSNKYQPSPTAPPLDRRSVSQGMKLVAIAADEYETGNDAVALDIYLSGIDKILMALPNKTDPRTKTALREKLQSVEERVGILNLAIQYKRLPNPHSSSCNASDEEDSLATVNAPNTSSTSMFSRLSTTISTISSIGSTTVQAWEETNNAAMQTYGQRDPIHRFKRFGRFVINTSVTCAVLIKQSPIPDLIGLICSYLVHILSYLDHHYEVRQKLQSVGIECVKMLLAADEHYHLHELASETLYMLIAASLKAAVAFKESPSYRHPSTNTTLSSPSAAAAAAIRRTSDNCKEPPQIEYQDTTTTTSPPASSGGSRLPWILSGWV